MSISHSDRIAPAVFGSRASRVGGRSAATVALADDSSAIVGDPRREHLWILAPAARLESPAVAAATAAARANGFDVERLVPTPHAGGPS